MIGLRWAFARAQQFAREVTSEFAGAKPMRAVAALASPQLSGLVTFEELNRPLVLLGLFARVKRAEIASLPRLRIDLSGIEAVLSGSQLSNHGYSRSPVRAAVAGARRRLITSCRTVSRRSTHSR